MGDFAGALLAGHVRGDHERRPAGDFARDRERLVRAEDEVGEPFQGRQHVDLQAEPFERLAQTPPLTAGLFAVEDRQMSPFSTSCECSVSPLAST